MSMHGKKADAGTAVTIDSSFDGGTLRLTVTGRVDIDGANRLMDRAVEESARHDVQRVFCDMRRVTPLVGTLHLNQQMVRLCQDELLTSLRVAVVVSVRSNFFVYFEELAAHNSLPIRVFTDGAQAEAWLNEPAAQVVAAT
jgi:hypothetical protein